MSLRLPGKSRLIILIAVFVLTAFGKLSLVQKAEAVQISSHLIGSFFMTMSDDAIRRDEGIRYLRDNWQNNLSPMVLEMVYLSRNASAKAGLMELLREKNGQDFGYDLNSWYQWVWQQDWQPHPEYAEFKSTLYGLIDPKFAEYFQKDRPTVIRLNEVRWGGVLQDGIPPLRGPKMISAKEASYLQDDNVVFGLAVNGDVRAYPKRILAWHEMFVDTIGNEPVAGVYCTLCGSMILYKTTWRGENHALGTSGFLYRSNKLMYDRKTQSLWSTLRGEPVIGPLVGKGIQLERLSVVTTTWGEWKTRHPETLVLSLETGHDRDYGEGVAYRSYFATDDLMFIVPELDNRLKNKDEVLGLIFQHAPQKPLAISSAFLQKKPIYRDEVSGYTFVVFTDRSGAHRVYETGDTVFADWDLLRTVRDSEGAAWTLTESALISGGGRKLHRLPSHNAFWFGWYSAYRHTRLVY